MNRKLVLGIVALSLGALSCQKEAGPGGNSAISGTVTGQMTSGGNSSEAEYEVTTVVCNHVDGVDGSIIDHNDYFLLNTPNNGTLYYVWYNNTNQMGIGTGPNLPGRTEIKVTYSNNETSTTIAANTAAAILSVASSDFDLLTYNDIITLTNKVAGEVTDADNVNTPFAIDILNQGQDAGGSGGSTITGPIPDERVFLIYGDEDVYSESVRTDASGRYQFKGLAKGSYKVFAFSKDPSNPTGFQIQKEVTAEITEKKQVVEAPNIDILK